jgi:hypothetical protein
MFWLRKARLEVFTSGREKMHFTKPTKPFTACIKKMVT